jgi:hypothetical protein
MTAIMTTPKIPRVPAIVLLPVLTYAFAGQGLAAPTPPSPTISGYVDTSATWSSQPAGPDKSRYNIFNPTPSDLWRPFYTDYGALSPFTIDAGAYAADVSFSYGYRSQDLNLAERTDTSWKYGSLWLKAGLCNRVDFEVGIQPWQTHTERLRDSTGQDSLTRSGFGDIMTRVKWNGWGNDGGSSAFSVAGTVKWPTASEELMRHDNFEGGLSMQFQYQTPCGLQVRANSGFNLSRSDRGCWDSCFNNRLVLIQEIPHVGGLSAYAGFNSDVSTSQRDTWNGDIVTGLTYPITPNFQGSVGADINVNGNGNDHSIHVGLAYRF